jgi:hypothetical protein
MHSTIFGWLIVGLIMLGGAFLMAMASKNNATFKVRMWFIDNYPDLYYHLPSYQEMMHDPWRWSKESWMEWLKQKAKI